MKKQKVTPAQAKVEKVVDYLSKALVNNAEKLGENLAKNITEAIGNAKTSITEFEKLAEEVAEAIIIGKPVVENAVKIAPKKKGAKKTATTPVAEPVVEQAPAEEPVKEEAPKAETKSKIKKGTPSKKAPTEKAEATKEDKKPLVTPKKVASPTKSTPMVEIMPTEFEVEVLGGKLVCDNSISTMADFNKAIEDGRELVIAMYWTKRMLKQYTYDVLNVGTPVKEFANDLDLLQPIFINQNGKALIAVSLYTEVATVIEAKHLEVDTETGIRYCNGAEFNIYELVRK